MKLIFLLSAATVFFFAECEEEKKKQDNKTTVLKIGFVQAGSFFSLHIPGPSPGFTRGGFAGDESSSEIELWKSKIGEKRIQKGFIADGGGIPFYSWRVSNGHFWGSNNNISLPYFERVPLTQIRKASQDHGEKWMKEWDSYNWTCEPVHKRIHIGGGLIPVAEPEIANAYFDFLPKEQNSMFLFLSYKKEILIWRGELQLEKKEVAWPKRKDKEGNETHPPTFRISAPDIGPFLTYDDPNRFYFVTLSGKLYFSPKRGKNLHAKKVWDEHRTIVGVVADNSSNTTYGFCKDAKNLKNSVFFQFSDKIRPIRYDHQKVPEGKGPAHDSIRAYVDLLIKQKKIVP